MAEFVLYNCPLSTCSQKVRMCLGEKGLDYINRHVDISRDEHLEPSYLAINPNGVVPTLVVDDVPVMESSVICEYIDETHPEPPLSPLDPLGKALMRVWMRFLEEVPTVAIRAPSFNRGYVGVFTQDELEARAKRRPMREELYREMGVDGFTEAKIQASLKGLRLTVERANNAMSREGPWLCGEMFTLADILLVPTIVRMEDLQLDHIWSDLDHFKLWYSRVQERPSFALAYKTGSRFTADIVQRFQQKRYLAASAAE